MCDPLREFETTTPQSTTIRTFRGRYVRISNHVNPQLNCGVGSTVNE